MKIKLTMIATLAGAALAGCANQPITTFNTFHANNLNNLVGSGALAQKTDNFYVVNDSSSSMSQPYEGAGYSGQPTPTKFSVEKEILNRMNQTIPDIKLTSGIRSFGFGPCLSWGFTQLNLPVENYSKSTFGQGIDSLSCSGGGTPMSEAITAAAPDLSSLNGNTALIILSDGNSQETAINSVQALKQQLGDKLCVYTVWVGNKQDSNGQILLQQMADASGCGFSTTAENVASNSDMAGFVQHVFLKSGTPTPVATDGDDDLDGVLNSKDRCPHTPKLATVNIQGCWSIKNILFDTDKSTIRSAYLSELDDVVAIIKDNPGLKIEVQGHTDSTGPAEYNMKLSKRRANAVRDYLVGQTGDPDALTARGYGETEPIDTNHTAAGRQNNRRVDLKILDGQYD